VGTGLSGSPSQVLYRDVADPFGGQVMASAGITREWSGMRMNIGYEGRFGDHADSHMGGISFTLQLP